MKTVADLLRDADPVRHDPHRMHEERDRIRRSALTAASDLQARASTRRSMLGILIPVAAAVAIAAAVVSPKVWSGGAALEAAVRFEVRLAETQPASGLRQARVSGSDSVVYLHSEIVVSNDDIAQSRVVPRGTSRFDVAVTFTAGGAGKMRQATANHIGKPVAILLDGEVVAAPTLRSPIGGEALITGDYTQAEADRIARGMSIR